MKSIMQVNEIVKWFINSCDSDNTPSRKEITRKLDRLKLSEHDLDFAVNQLSIEYEAINDLKAKIKRTRINAIMGLILVAPNIFGYIFLMEVTEDRIRWKITFFLGSIICFFSGFYGLYSVRKMKRNLAERHQQWPNLFDKNPCLKGHTIIAVYT